jgi:hypothetical protein
MEIILNKIIKSLVSGAAKAKKILWMLGRGAFLLILLIIFFEVALGIFLFYIYVFLPQNQTSKVSDDSVYFKEDVYQNIISEWQDRGQKFKDYSQKDYTSLLK